MTEVETEPARFVGARARRTEDPRLLSGQGHYVGDIALGQMAHVAFVRSPFPLATIDSIERQDARAAAGVRAVLTGEELSADLDMPGGWHGSVLASEFVAYVGEPVVMVIADSRAEAEDAVELVEVRYSPMEPAIDLERAIAGAPFAHPGETTNVFATSQSDGYDEIDEVLKAAPHVFTETIDQHRYVQSPMETRGVVARWQAASQSLTVWISTQGPHPTVAHFAKIMKLSQSAVRVIAEDVGGAFGQKIRTSREETAIAVAARLIGRPVKWIEDRYENLAAGPHARRELAYATVAADDEGHILAIKADHYADGGAWAAGSPRNFMSMIPGAYRVANVAVRSASVRTNTSSRAAYRGPWMFETVVREVMVDIVARGLGLDPLEVRRRNVLQPDELPYRTSTGNTYDVLTATECLERAAELIDYAGFRRRQAEARAEGRYLGIGFSLFVEPTAAGARRMSDGVTIRIDTDGTVLVSTGAGSQGHSVETTICQVVADELGVDLADVRIQIGDTASTPFGATTGGSRNAISGGNSAIRAASELRERIFEIAAHDLEASPEDLELRDGAVSVRGTPTKRRTLGEIASLATSSGNLPDGMDPGLETTGRFTPSVSATYSNAAHVMTCEVDIETGVTKIDRYIVAEDCGVMINPNVVEGQIAGGVIQGIGGVLYEHFVYDNEGNPLTTTYLDYLLPTTTEVPEIEYAHLETRANTNPGGFKGLGEGGAIGAPAAVMNAIADALSPFGVKAIHQPLTPPAVLASIDGASAS